MFAYRPKPEIRMWDADIYAQQQLLKTNRFTLTIIFRFAHLDTSRFIMSNTSSNTIIVVGGGFAGAVTAIHLIRAALDNATRAPLEIHIVESDGEIGRGIAYSTRNDDHIVNGPAALFGLYPNAPSHLVEWLEANAAAHGWAPPPGVPFTDAFPSRWLYGTYVQSTLQQAIASAGARVRLQIVEGRAVDLQLENDRYRLTLADGGTLVSSRLVLATGLHRARAERFLPESDVYHSLGARYIDDVWSQSAWGEVAHDREILIVGTGLSALDAALSAQRAGFTGRFHLLSRRGLLVHPRRQCAPWPGVLDADRLPTTLRDLLRATRAARRAIAAAGDDWQRLPPAVRPFVQALWECASDTERRRFLRHLRPFWEIALHRAGPESGKRLDEWIGEKRLVRHSGRLQAVRLASGDRVEAEWLPRGGGPVETLHVDRVINASGYEFDWSRIDDPFVRALLSRQLVRRHSSGFGIEADATTGAVISGAGDVQPTLFAVGHPLRGAAWEANSIQEQVGGAINSAKALVASLQAA
ncbi:Uncharacterized NAD(P)/FAD-binding protein YdhS [Burkholderia sp. CF099]|nr:Uncharacterized NAD(P)/FAD-binding protein YdhS [Burkholderia sp. CF099]